MKTKFFIEYYTEWGEGLVLESGDCKYPMEYEGDGLWTLVIPDCSAAFLREYRYLVMRDGIVERCEWTSHSGRSAAEIHDCWLDCPIPGCRFTRGHSASIFDRPHFRGAGTAVPVFSLRGAGDFGIGDFRDLRPLVDWVSATGQCMIQLLPINDTTRRGGWEDSYPYSPVSSFALHPLYIRLQDIGVEEDAAFRKTQAELNALQELDYPRVFEAKMALVRQAWEKCGKRDLAGSAYKKFYTKNASWLGEYCEFCAKRDSLETEYYAWIQFHLDRQLSEEVAYAHSKGVFLKGDLPIGVSADSADAYWHPELFNLDSSAGAPPDFFSRDGQNWGFPTYDWEAMAADGYAWWKARLRKMSEYFDAFRIDHILGFFRIWEIPSQFHSGMEGHFNPALPYSTAEIAAMKLPLKGLFHEDPRHEGMYQPYITPSLDGLEDWQKERFGAVYDDFFFHRHNDFWRRNAMRKLPELLGATGMLACGEDLGMVPECVGGVMDHERILSLKMRGMENEGPWKELSVCATSSHDMQTLRMQFESDPRDWECRNVLAGMLNSASMLAIFPLQDWLSISGDLRRGDRDAERINEPANPRHHWRYRIHLNLERLSGPEAYDLNSELRGLLDASGRINGNQDV